YLVAEQLLARDEPVALAAEIEPGLAQRRERAVDPAALALELADALGVLRGLGEHAVEPPARLVAPPRQRLELRIRRRDLGAPRGELAAGLVELALRAGEHLSRLAGCGFARADLGGLARDLGLERGELVAPRRELLGGARPLPGDVVDLGARTGDPAVEL